MNPIMINPIPTARTICTNSHQTSIPRRSGFVHLFNRLVESLTNCLGPSMSSLRLSMDEEEKQQLFHLLMNINEAQVLLE
jgi:hypothetical protein